ncbi:alpha-crystallin B chain [Diabrotica virgifera virgifera]|uniref:Alpha-crystallin B chain-like n=1 Tax=Diabrotica virgifera virgifera TaxID=50390 RepID=A0A6P7FGP9_DIAVI|nr:alpha-crystallin B chain [Diabrotica virgifera virgifera]
MAFIPVVFRENQWAPHCPRRQVAVPNRNFVEDITHDVLNSIALAQALFGPEQDRGDTEVMRQNSKLLNQSRSSVTIDEHKFQANFDVQHFKPEEITVKVNGDRSITIEAEHEEKQDEHGGIYRHFVRKYKLPENCDIEKVDSKLSSDGVLSITAPTIGQKSSSHRTIPIIQTGKPIKPAEKPQVEQKSA